MARTLLNTVMLDAPKRRVVAFLALFCVELAIISLAYTFTVDFECKLLVSPSFCEQTSMLATRAMLALCFFGLFAFARPKVIEPIWSAPTEPRPFWMTLHILGVALILIPWFFIQGLGDPQTRLVILSFWGVGALCASAGALLTLADASAWRRVLTTGGLPMIAVLAFALLVPEFAWRLEALWEWQPLTNLTFSAVLSVIQGLGYDPFYDRSQFGIAVYEFGVLVGAPCAGIEGFALITAFLTGYIWMFRHELRLPLALILFPIGIALSWAFNVLRIALLLLIGAHGAPELAVGGFHSHAGWLMFTLLSLGLIGVSRAIPALRAEPRAQRVRAAPPPFFLDRDAAEIMPFIVFMAADLLLSTFTATPGVFYPIKAVVTALALTAFWRVLRGIDWSLSPMALGSGAIIGAAWIIAQLGDATTGGTAEIVAQQGAIAFAVWAVFRVLGTVVIVPIVEELFFRGYVLRKFDLARPLTAALGVAVSAGLFAALHSRWELAFLAGLAFGALYLRRRKIADPIIAHAVANLTIAIWAIATGNWAII